MLIYQIMTICEREKAKLRPNRKHYIKVRFWEENFAADFVILEAHLFIIA